MKTVIIGVGNLIMGDEGIGIHVVKELQAENKFSQDVEIIDGGTSSFELQLFIEKSEKIIIIDAIKGKKKPGTIYKLSPEKLKRNSSSVTSLHQLNFLHVLELSKMRGYNPKVIIYGIEPEKVELSLELSDNIKSMLPKVVKLINEEVEGR